MPADNLIGQEGMGFRYILDGMKAERILIAGRVHRRRLLVRRQGADHTRTSGLCSIGRLAEQGVHFRSRGVRTRARG